MKRKIMLFVIGIFCVCLFGCEKRDLETQVVSDCTTTMESESSKEDTTCVSIRKKITKENIVYQIPFQKTGLYKGSKELDIEDAERQKIIKVVGDFYQNLLETDYRSIAEDVNAYEINIVSEIFGSYIVLSDGTEVSASEYVADIADWMIENEFSAEVSYSSADDLIFMDHNILYNRGILEVTVHGCNDTSKLTRENGEQLQIGQTYKLVIDTGLSKGQGENDDYKIFSIEEQNTIQEQP